MAARIRPSQRLGRQGVVGIVHAALRDVQPRRRQAASLQSRTRLARRWPDGVVHLDRHLLRQRAQVGVIRQRSGAGCHADRRGREEIFCSAVQALALSVDPRGSSTRDGARQRLVSAAAAKSPELEALRDRKDRRRARAPKTRHWPGGSSSRSPRRVNASERDEVFRLPRPIYRLRLTTQPPWPKGKGRLGAFELPGMGLRQPVFGGLVLAAVDEGLPEQPMLPPGCHTAWPGSPASPAIHETGRQPPQPAIPQRRVGFVQQHGVIVQKKDSIAARLSASCMLTILSSSRRPIRNSIDR